MHRVLNSRREDMQRHMEAWVKYSKPHRDGIVRNILEPSGWRTMLQA
jgi:hypothetical protein